MPRKPPQPTTGPTRRTFEILLRELNDRCGWRAEDTPALIAAQKKYEELEDRLRNNPALKRARALVERLRQDRNKQIQVYRNRLKKIRNLYHVRGLVPSVIVMMNALVETVDRNL